MYTLKFLSHTMTHYPISGDSYWSLVNKKLMLCNDSENCDDYKLGICPLRYMNHAKAINSHCYFRIF